MQHLILRGPFRVCLPFLLTCAWALLTLTGCGASSVAETKAAEAESAAGEVYGTETGASAGEVSETQTVTPVIKVVGEEVEAALNRRMKRCGTLEEAREVCGFPLTVPDSIGEYEQVRFRAIEGEIVEVLYRSPEGEEIQLRKGPGQDDISGDYTSYNRFDFSIVGNVSVFHRFDDQGTRVATWTNGTWAGGTFTYAVTSTVGLVTEVLESIIRDFV